MGVLGVRKVGAEGVSLGTQRSCLSASAALSLSDLVVWGFWLTFFVLRRVFGVASERVRKNARNGYRDLECGVRSRLGT